MNIIYLCGSTRFRDQFDNWGRELTLAGNVVLSIATSVKHDFTPTEQQKQVLDMVHFAKVSMCNLVVVINQERNPRELVPADELHRHERYVGYSTNREIMWANLQKKPIVYISDLPDLEPYSNILNPRFKSPEQLFDEEEV